MWIHFARSRARCKTFRHYSLQRTVDIERMRLMHEQNTARGAVAEVRNDCKPGSEHPNNMFTENFICKLNNYINEKQRFFWVRSSNQHIHKHFYSGACVRIRESFMRFSSANFAAWFFYEHTQKRYGFCTTKNCRCLV